MNPACIGLHITYKLHLRHSHMTFSHDPLDSYKIPSGFQLLAASSSCRGLLDEINSSDTGQARLAEASGSSMALGHLQGVEVGLAVCTCSPVRPRQETLSGWLRQQTRQTSLGAAAHPWYLHQVEPSPTTES